MSYLYIFRDKETGQAEIDISRFQAPIKDNHELIITIKLSDIFAASEVAKWLTPEKVRFGVTQLEYVDLGIYREVLDERNELLLKCEAMRKTIDLKSETIESYGRDITRLSALCETVNEANLLLRKMLEKIMNTLALQAIVMKPHWERNEDIRKIAREIYETVNMSDDEIVSSHNELDDIPF